MNSIRSSKEYWKGTHENIVIDNSSFFRAQSLGVTKLGRELVWHSQHCIILDGNDCWNESIAMNWIASGRVYITDAWQSIRNREEKKIRPRRYDLHAIASTYNLLIWWRSLHQLVVCRHLKLNRLIGLPFLNNFCPSAAVSVPVRK